MEDKLLTLPEVSRVLKIPVSTIRYWKEKLPDFFIEVGDGRFKKYPPNTLDIVKDISESVESGFSFEEIDNKLSQTYPKTVIVDDNKVVNQQPSHFLATEGIVKLFQQHFDNQKVLLEYQQNSINQLADTMQTIVRQQEKLFEMSEKINKLETIINQQQQQKRPWWKFWQAN